ncbi:enolase C-terminal domain-like protein [Ruania halotolerans]|uniref:enolase C-terminal domain-like protein n=1 Tax=Ruania halotolerans TaxID=2897773 RepID=UPI001E2F8FC6|nr:enolase C-terminal domain-like protein [Ruania halotolerans]UFU06885.1 fuconate dehydratase [Ruania halotolerans]
MSKIVAVDVTDVRFPTSADLDGSDAMNPDPDYSAAYLRVGTDSDEDSARGHAGYGFVFTIGRGNDVQVAAVRSLAERLIGRDAEELLADLGGVWRELVYDSQWRWLGPEKGVSHMAVGAVVNALWDLRAKREGLPLWQLLARLSPAEIVDLVDFRYLSDALTREEALELLTAAEPGRAEREATLLAEGYPAYTTTPGWLGYSDEKLEHLSKEAVADGYTQIKLKVGSDLAEDKRRLRIARDAVGPDVKIAIDANQRWDVTEAIDWVNALAEFDLAWIEEPTNPDDVLAHAAISRGVAPVPVATGEHAANRVIFKQLLQAGGAQVVQIDATRVAGVNENLAILLLAAKFGVRVCPHAGGVGLCEVVQHLSMFDVVALSGTTQDRMIEYVDHLHEHFVEPVVIENARYRPPQRPGSGAEMHAASVEQYTWAR